MDHATAVISGQRDPVLIARKTARVLTPSSYTELPKRRMVGLGFTGGSGEKACSHFLKLGSTTENGFLVARHGLLDSACDQLAALLI